MNSAPADLTFAAQILISKPRLIWPEQKVSGFAAEVSSWVHVESSLETNDDDLES